MEEETLRLKVGSQVRERRKEKGLTGRQLAELAGMTESTINKIENGRWSVSLDILEKVCNVLGVTVTLTQV